MNFILSLQWPFWGVWAQGSLNSFRGPKQNVMDLLIICIHLHVDGQGEQMEAPW